MCCGCRHDLPGQVWYCVDMCAVVVGMTYLDMCVVVVVVGVTYLDKSGTVWICVLWL